MRERDGGQPVGCGTCGRGQLQQVTAAEHHLWHRRLVQQCMPCVSHMVHHPEQHRWHNVERRWSKWELLVDIDCLSHPLLPAEIAQVHMATGPQGFTHSCSRLVLCPGCPGCSCLRRSLGTILGASGHHQQARAGGPRPCCNALACTQQQQGTGCPPHQSRPPHDRCLGDNTTQHHTWQ